MAVSQTRASLKQRSAPQTKPFPAAVSIESFQNFNLKRSMFYGSAIVHAVEGESKTAPSCRIFLHDSLNDEDVENIKKRLDVLPITKPRCHAPRTYFLGTLRRVEVQRD
jgi:hypothetical protein